MLQLPSGVKTAILLASLIGLLVLVGYRVGGTTGMLVAFVVGLAVNGSAYWFSDHLVLRMAGAREVRADEAPELYRLVAELAQRANLVMPRVYVVATDAPNAFATGRNLRHAAVAVTTGLLKILDRDELAAVIAHELGHIRNRDTLISVVAATIVGAITMIAHVVHWSLLLGGLGRSDEEELTGANLIGTVVLIFLAPLAAMIVQLAISRAREFAADATGAQIVGNPMMLASALRKLECWSERHTWPVDPAMAHLFIVNPLRGQALFGLFRTHPPTGQRIARLEYMLLERRQGRHRGGAYLARRHSGESSWEATAR